AEDGSVQTITIRGWIGFEDQDIAQFGYNIGKNDPVFSDSFTEERGDIGAIQDPGNGGSHAQAFKIVVDVLNVYGSTKIVAVAKLADGTVVEIDESVPRNGEGTTPNTSFTFVGPADPNPETVPATGDATIAMFAVIVVLAMGAAVVFMKKRAF
ncbi:MAG: LPXTG cell wall anchor domain-containing protein, partial [Clostridia bacterium]|nr:LPXTG cell wall anchor domain-containing protein [Clostridia bacterium]